MKKRRVLTLLLMLILVIIPFSTFADPDTDQYDEDGFPIPRTLDEDTPLSKEDLFESWYKYNIYNNPEKDQKMVPDQDDYIDHNAYVRMNNSTYTYIPNSNQYFINKVELVDINKGLVKCNLLENSCRFLPNHLSKEFKIGLTDHVKTIDNYYSQQYQELGWEGNLNQYVFSGSEAHTKEVENEDSPNYNKDGYTGTLQPYDPGDGSTKYRGQVSKPDDRVYKYRGTVRAIEYNVPLKMKRASINSTYRGITNIYLNRSKRLVESDSNVQSALAFRIMQKNDNNDNFDISYSNSSTQLLDISSFNIGSFRSNSYEYWAHVQGKSIRYLINHADPITKHFCRIFKEYKSPRGYRSPLFLDCDFSKFISKVKFNISYDEGTTIKKGALKIFFVSDFEFLELTNTEQNQNIIEGTLNEMYDDASISNTSNKVFIKNKNIEYRINAVNSRTTKPATFDEKGEKELNIYLTIKNREELTRDVNIFKTTGYLKYIYYCYNNNQNVNSRVTCGYIGSVKDDLNVVKVPQSVPNKFIIKTFHSGYNIANSQYNIPGTIMHARYKIENDLLNKFYFPTVKTRGYRNNNKALEAPYYNNKLVYINPNNFESPIVNYKEELKNVIDGSANPLRNNYPALKFTEELILDPKYSKDSEIWLVNKGKIELNDKLDVIGHFSISRILNISSNRARNLIGSTLKDLKLTNAFKVIKNKDIEIIEGSNTVKYKGKINFTKIDAFANLYDYKDLRNNLSINSLSINRHSNSITFNTNITNVISMPIKVKLIQNKLPETTEDIEVEMIVKKAPENRKYNKNEIDQLEQFGDVDDNEFSIPFEDQVNTKYIPVITFTDPEIAEKYEQKTFEGICLDNPRENYFEDIVIPITIGPKNAFTGTVTWNGKPYNATQTITAKHNGQQFTTVEVTPNDTTYVAENPPGQDVSQYSIEATQIPFTRTEIDGLNITNTYLGRTENMFIPVTYPLNTQINPFYIKLGNSITKVDPVSFTTRPKTTEVLTKVHTLENVRFDDMQGNILMHKIQFSKSEAGPWTDSLTDGQFSITSQTPQSKVQATCTSYSTTNTDLCGNNGKYSAPSVTIAYTPETKTIGGTLTWANEVDGQGNRYNLNLQLNDANDLQVPHTNSNYQFAGTFPVTNEYGEEIQYTVTQKSGTESQHYRFQVDPSNFNITMTYKPPGIDKSQALEWSGGENDASFKVKCKVLKDGQLHEEKDIIRGVQECRFERLPEDDGHGHTYNYTIQITSDKGHTITPRSGQATLITYVPKQEQFSFAAELNGGYKLLTRLQAELWERHGVTDKKLKDIILTKEATAETFQPIQETLPLTTQDGTAKEYYLKNPTQVDAFNVTVRNNMALKTFYIIPTFTNKTTTLTWKTRFIGGESLSLTPKYQIKRDSFTETITGNTKPNDYSNFDQSQFTHTISTLKKYDETGLVINWRDHLKAIEVPERWQVRFQGDTATWTYTPPQTTLNIEAEITGGHTLLTSLTADIYEQYGSVNRKVKTVTLTKAKNDAQFQPITETLPQFSSGGEQITYTLKNPSKKDAFEISVRPSTTTIVVNFINAKTTLTWKTQFRGGETLDLTPKYFIKKDELEITVTANDKPHSYDNFNQSQFTHTEMHLDKYNADGTTINWLSHIRPHQVPSEWTAEFHGDIATWTYNIPKTSKTFKVKAKEAVSLNLMNKGTVAYTKGITAENTQVIFSDINQTNTKGEEIEYTLALADTAYFEMNYDQDTETYIIERKAIPVPPPPTSNNNQNFKTQDVRIKVIWETPNKVNLPVRIISGSYRSEPHYFGNGSNKEETYTFNGVRVYNGNFSLDVTTPAGYSTSKVDANTIKVIKVNSIISDSSNSSTGTNHSNNSNNSNNSNSTNQSNTTPSSGSPGNPITIGSGSSSSNSSNTSNSTESNESSRDNRDDRSSRGSRDDRNSRDDRSSSDDRVTEPSTNTNNSNTTKPSTNTNTTTPSTNTTTPSTTPSTNTTTPSIDITKPTANTNNTIKPFNPFKPAEDSPTVDPYNPSINTTDPAPMRETPSQFKPSEPFISDTVAGKKVEEPKVPDKITEITTESNIKGNIDPYIPPEVNSKPVKSTQQKQQSTQQQSKQPKKSKTAQLLTRDSNTKATQNEDIDLSFLNDPSEVNPADTIETKSNKQDKKQQLLTQGQDATTVQSSVIFAYDESGQPIYQPITQPIGTDEDGQPIYGYDSNGDPIYEPVMSSISESNQTTLSPEESEPIAYTEDGRPIYAFTENGQPIFEPLIEPTSYTEDGTPIYGYNDKGKPILRDVRVEGFQANIKKVTDKAKNLPLPAKAAAGGGVLVTAISGAFIFLKRR